MSQFLQDLEETVKSQAWRLQAHIVHAHDKADLLGTLNAHLTASFSGVPLTEDRLRRAGLKTLLHSRWGLGEAALASADLSPQWDGVCQVEGTRSQLDGWLYPQFHAWANAISEYHPEAMVMLSGGASSPNVTLELRIAAGACLVLPQTMAVQEHQPMVLIPEPLLVSHGLSRVLMESHVPSPKMLAVARAIAYQDLPSHFQAAQAWLKALALEKAFESKGATSVRVARI